ncbi:nitroreductase [Amycolatopsis sp. K13G38]|uniref:Nitroreductase n=1 Tax=Amycolatopsis acididurans TaxID=2724524 RepID=A0ABX1JC62_9PSEU|nr:nitroreductase family protein [Amycolatopsis acididurans]NKQ57263.1 nitroreductase [Amycolatopsis acididurans]
MEFWNVLTARRNVRSYEDRPVPQEDLDRIVEAGRRAPSSRNTQPWDFVVVTDRDQLSRLAKVWQGAQHVAHSAATIALIAPAVESEGERVQFDLGQATANMMLTAADLGVGSGHSAVLDQVLARELLGFPEDRVCAYLIALGYPADRPLKPVRNPDRRPFDEVMHRGRW